MSFAGATYRDVGEGLLTGTEMTQREAASPNPTLVWEKSQELEIWSTQHSLLAAQQVGECSFSVAQLVCTSLMKLGWLFPVSSWADLCSFHAAWCEPLLRKSACLRITLSSLYSRRRGLVNLVGFRDFWSYFELFASCLNGHPCRMECFTFP